MGFRGLLRGIALLSVFTFLYNVLWIRFILACKSPVQNEFWADRQDRWRGSGLCHWLPGCHLFLALRTRHRHTADFLAQRNKLTTNSQELSHFRPHKCPSITDLKKKLHGLSPRANYTDRAIAACRRNDCKLLRIEGATWSAWRIPTAVFSVL
jgi:hypothetical protein